MPFLNTPNFCKPAESEIGKSLKKKKKNIARMQSFGGNLYPKPKKSQMSKFFHKLKVDKNKERNDSDSDWKVITTKQYRTRKKSGNIDIKTNKIKQQMRMNDYKFKQNIEKFQKISSLEN